MTDPTTLTATPWVQAAMYALLQNLTIPASSPWRPKPVTVQVLDAADENQPFPYVTFGSSIETNTDILTHRGRELIVTWDVWSQWWGWDEGDAIADQIALALDRAQLDTQNVSVWRCAYIRTSHIRDPDGLTRHVPVEFRVSVQIP